MAHKKYTFAAQALPGNMQQRHKILHHTTSEICYHFTIIKQNIAKNSEIKNITGNYCS